MITYHRNVLFEVQHAAALAVWFYRNVLDRNPHAFVDDDRHKDLTDFAQRVHSIARSLIDDDSTSRRAKRPVFKPPTPEKTARLFDLLEARRAARAKAAAEAASSPNEPPFPWSAPEPFEQPAPESGHLVPEENVSSDRGLWSPPKPRLQ